MVLKKTKFSIYIIISIGIIVSMSYFFFPNENTQETRSFQVVMMTGEEYRDEQIRKIRTGNTHADFILSKCGNDDMCVVEAIQKLSKSETQEIVLEVIDELLDVFQTTELICHKYAHHIGKFLLGYSNGNLTKALTLASGKCGGAQYHGIVENYFLTGFFSGNLKLENLQISDSCDILSNNPRTIVRVDCAHGFGHGLFKVLNFNISSSVLKCDEFKTILERDACYRGIFMENQIQILGKTGGVFDENDILYPCNILSGDEASACYHYHTSHILRQHQFSLNKAFSECSKIIPEKFVKACYYGIGVKVRAANLNLSSDKIISKCQVGEPKYHSFCVAGGAGYMAKQIGTDEALEYCKSVPNDFQIECYKAVGRMIILNSSTTNEIHEKCSIIEKSDHFEACTEANLEERAEL